MASKELLLVFLWSRGLVCPSGTACPEHAQVRSQVLDDVINHNGLVYEQVDSDYSILSDIDAYGAVAADIG